MVGSYVGIAVAFVFAVAVPGRAIPRLLADDAPTALYVASVVVLSVAAIFASLKLGGRSGSLGKKRGNPTGPAADSNANQPGRDAPSVLAG
jgi:hypothetical protein